MHNTLSNTLLYVVLEVLDVVLEVYHTQHIFKYTMCVLLEVVDALEVLPYATHFQTYVVLEVKHVVLEVYHTQRTFKICCV